MSPTPSPDSGVRRPGARLRDRLTALRAAGRFAVVPFVVLGDPDIETSDAVLRALCEGGADALELGLAFSDPPADGPVIQAADARALRAGVRVDDAFALLSRHAARSELPVSLLIYWNLVLQRGVDRFYADCARSGVDAVLVADIPLEECDEMVAAALRHGVAPVFLATPLSSDARLLALAAHAQGYVYVTARVGITGERGSVDANLDAEVARVRRCFDLPLLCGFGISGPEQLLAVRAAGADGAIVGSATVRRIADNLGDPDAIVSALRAVVRTLRLAADSAAPDR